jgi:hypothetical protein
MKVFALALHRSGSMSMTEALEMLGIRTLFVNSIYEGDGWEKLCPFLGKPIPDAPFPVENTAKQTYLSPWYQAKRRGRDLGSRVEQAVLGVPSPLRGSS